MKHFFKYLFAGTAAVILLSIVTSSDARSYKGGRKTLLALPDTGDDGDTLPFPFDDKSGLDPLYWGNNNSPLKLHDPSNIKTDITYNSDSGTYDVSQRMGGLDYRRPMSMSLEEYMRYDLQKTVHDYWRQRVHAESDNQARGNRGLIPPIKINSQAFDRIFGGGTIDIRPQGSAELIFGVNINRTDNPALPERQRRISTFDFDEKIQLNVVGKIGDKLKLTTNYNTEATFDWENQMKLEYTGYEDEIIKKIEAGNVNLPLNSTLITGSQSLFGVKTQLQFGRLTMTSVISQQKGKKSEVNVQGGAQVSNFEVNGDNYEANKHFFLSNYFYNHYDGALANFPVVNSGVNITRVEVWVTNRTGAVDNTRNIVAFTDLGEANLENNIGGGFVINAATDSLPDNSRNNLYERDTTLPAEPLLRDINTVQQGITALNFIASDNFQQTVNWEKVTNARKLAPTEFTYNSRLGYISLNQSLNYDEVLAVAYQYTVGGHTYQVGEFSTDGVAAPSALFVKLLKNTNFVPTVTTYGQQKRPSRLWSGMMKNIYSIGAYQINPQDFKLDVWYNNPSTGTDITFIPDGPINGKPLLQVLSLDKLNQSQQLSPDGVFDFIEGVTIISANGRIIFPTTQPFGNYLEAKLGGATNPQLDLKYVYHQLYDSTKTAAQQFPDKNRFKLKGQYKSSSSSEINLNAPNIPQGSVTVTAGGAPLVENQDYTVDYAIGRVKIINEGILNSGVPIKVSLESNSLFSIQSKTLFGTHFDYKVNRDFNLGATIMNLTERPLTQKINIGDEPMSNWMWGMDLNYRTEAPFLTRWIDKIPLIQTKEMSNIAAQGEIAGLIPGHNSVIGKNGNSYIDDFEGTQSLIDIRSPQGWSLASIPQGQSTWFPEASLHDSLASGYNRAKLSWYVIDPLFQRTDNSLKPANISTADQSNHFVREVPETEVFPNKQPPNGQPLTIPTLDLAYYPNERGPYNFDVNQTGVSKGLNADGTLKNPETRWGGIMRKIETSDFESANIEFVQFWMMDPYNEDNALADQNQQGELVVDLGNVSEDVLNDSRNSFENGLTYDANGNPTLFDVTNWGHVPVVQSIVNAFDNDPDTRRKQDVGLDGLNDDNEGTFFNNYMQQVSALGTSSQAYANAVKDPSGDNYHYFRGSDYDGANGGAGTPILQRYKMYNGLDGNSPESGQPNDDGVTESFPTQSTTLPNQEDINRDNTLNETESYYQYRIKLNAGDVSTNNVGNNYITDAYTTSVPTKDGRTRNITWYQFKIPVRQFEQKIGNIEGYNSIRFIRIFFKGVEKPVICRFARLELVRADWRKYNFSLVQPGEYIGNDQGGTSFNVSAVNIEENGYRVPVNYVLPPGIDREQNVQSANLVRLNEQSLSLRVCDLEDGDSRACYKNTSLDVRSYKKLRMYIHAEKGAGSEQPLNDNDITCFIRLGSDYTDNYYEYEIPLKVTPPGSYGANDDEERKKVWPEANNMELAFEVLQLAKQKRNLAISDGTATLTTEYVTYDSDRRVTVKGNPNLSSIKTIMIGIRNPKKTTGSTSDDGYSKCAEVWVNELRLTDFDEHGGYAATARVTAKLADFGTLNLSGNLATPGFGSIEKKVSERLRETQLNYDISTQLELSKFLPEKVGIRVPMFWGYGETFITPQYNPLDPDILMSSLNSLPPEVRQEIRDVTVDYTRRKSLNFTNVHKERGKGATKQHIWDIENFGVSYAYTELYRHNVDLEFNTIRTYRGGLTYAYNNNPKTWKPFGDSKSKLMKSKWMALVKDINLNLGPSMLGFTNDINRLYSEQKNRNKTGLDDVIIPINYNKNFTWGRHYDLRYDITKNLKLEFSADNDAQILEPAGRIDTKEEKDTIMDHLRGFGENMNYHHNTSLNYNVPINKIPVLDWLTASVRYTTTYSWQRAPLAADSIGNVISNTSQWQYSAQGNLTTLYNKIPYFKKVNQKKIGGTPAPAGKTPVGKDGGKGGKDDGKGGPKSDTTKTKKKDDSQYMIVDYLARIVMSLRQVSVNYSENSGMALPGYAHRTQILGFDEHFEGPSTGFLFGQQDHFGDGNVEYPIYASQQGWLVQTQSLYTPFTRTNSKNLTARANLEPFPDLRIELNGTRTYAINKSEFFHWNNAQNQYVIETPTETGNFSISIISWRTAFKKDNKEHESEIFQQYLNNRAAISQRFGAENGASNGYQSNGIFRDGYGITQQDVNMAAFFAAYTGKNANNSSLNPFPAIPMPNWRITYDGLSKIPQLKKYFKSMTVGHSYRSTYSLSSFNTNLNYDLNFDGMSDNLRNAANDFESKYQINSISISEQFAPLINFDMTWQNSLMTKVEYKKDRTMNLSLINYQLTEISGHEIVIGTGYRFKEVPLKFMKKIMKKVPKSDLNLRCDISFRNNQTVIRKAVEGINVLSAGQNILSIKLAADYVLNDRLNVRLFCDRIQTNPLVSSSFKTANTNAGVSLRFTLAQ